MRISDWSSDVCSSDLPFGLVEEEGCALGDIAAAFVAVERLLEMPAIWEALDTAKIDEGVRLSLFAQASSAMTSQMADLLRVTQSLSQPGRVVARLEPGELGRQSRRSGGRQSWEMTGVAGS